MKQDADKIKSTLMTKGTTMNVVQGIRNKYKKHLKEGNIGITTKTGKTIELTHKKSGKEIVVTNTPSTLKKYARMGYLISMPEGKLTEKKESTIDVVKRIVKDKQQEQGVDVQTANLILQIYNAYDHHPALQRKFGKIPLKKMAHMVWKFGK